MPYLDQQAAERYPVVTATGRDLTAWAKRLVWRDRMGDKSLTMIQIQFAYQALGIDPKAPKETMGDVP
jgi:hypothetical protein